MIPLFSILFAVSLVFKFFPPRNINSFYGYRTKKSRENSTNWKVANEYSADLMVKLMTPLFLVTVLLHFLGLEFNTSLSILLALSFVTIIILTEKKLKEL